MPTAAAEYAGQHYIQLLPPLAKQQQARQAAACTSHHTYGSCHPAGRTCAWRILTEQLQFDITKVGVQRDGLRQS